MAYSLLPLGICFILIVLGNIKKIYYTLFGLQFVLIALTMLADLPIGILTISLTASILVLFAGLLTYERVDWKDSKNGMLILYLVWGVFCLLQLANPNHVQSAWNISITHYVVYPIVCAVLLPIAIRSIKGVEWLLIIWSIFILLGAAKGYWQKNHGFTPQELHFLFDLGGAKTHIIWSGIRYFSFFTDAANFGVHMAMGIATFGISIFYVTRRWMKIYFGIVVLAAIYGLGISGTRSAVAVPVGALMMFCILSRSKKAAITGGITLVFFFCFFMFTNIGDSNRYIHKMRSAFSPSKDASYQVRVQNRESMKEFMRHKPIGYGLGLSKGDRFHPKELMPYPPDSWLVSVWVENGIIGLILYLAIHGVLFAWCSWILMFKLRSKQLRGLLAAWLCMAAGFFLSAYGNDVMQYPNSYVVYTAFALCFAGPGIERYMKEDNEHKEREKQKQLI